MSTPVPETACAETAVAAVARSQETPESPKALSLRNMVQGFDRFLFDYPDPTICSVIRIAYGLLMLVYVALWIPHAAVWFTDQGVLHSETAWLLALQQSWSLFFWLPATSAVVTTALVIMLGQALLLTIGVASRFQAACLFVWLISFQARNDLVCDGQDTLIRLFAGFLIFMPLDARWSLLAYVRGRSSSSLRRVGPAWGLRLMQFQMTIVYISTAWEKLRGETWLNGTAMHYVVMMDDLFGRGWVPEAWLMNSDLLRIVCWATLVIEVLLPILLWIPRTRLFAVLAGILFHLGIEYTMHIFLFEWAMIVGLLSFLSQRGWRERLSSG